MSNPNLSTETAGNRPKRRAERDVRTPQEQAEAERLFKLENAEAFASMNEWVERNGLPLSRYRQF